MSAPTFPAMTIQGEWPVIVDAEEWRYARGRVRCGLGDPIIEAARFVRIDNQRRLAERPMVSFPVFPSSVNGHRDEAIR